MVTRWKRRFKKGIRGISIFENYPEVEFLRTISKFRKERKFRSFLFTSSLKRENYEAFLRGNRAVVTEKKCKT